MVSSARDRALAEPSWRISQTWSGLVSNLRRRSWMGASSATTPSASQPLHSMQPMPAVVQPSRTFACVSAEENLVQIEDRADIGIAGIAATNARRIGDHGLQLLANHRLRIGQQDGVAVALRHLAAIRAGQLWRGRQQRLRLRKNKRLRSQIVKLIESPRHFPRQLHMRHLVLPDRNEIRLIDQNVRRLQQRIAEEPIGAQVFAPSSGICRCCSL